MNSIVNKITSRAISIGVFCCLLGAIWSPEELVKWALSAVYLIIVGKYFGHNYRKEKVIGSSLQSPYEKLNFLNMRKI